MDYIDKLNVSGVDFAVKDSDTATTLATEITTRASADTALDTKIDNTLASFYKKIKELPEGSTTEDAKVEIHEQKLTDVTYGDSVTTVANTLKAKEVILTGSNNANVATELAEHTTKLTTLASKADDMGLSVEDGKLCITFNN